MNLVELSQRIKQRRLALGKSLEEVAAAAGQTRSWLSKVENFRVTPSLPALARVAEVLDVSVSSLMEGLDAKPKVTLTRKADWRKIERDPQYSNIVYFALVNNRSSRQIDPLLLEIPAQGGRTVKRSHEGEEFLIVLSGKVMLEYGEESYLLNEGDTMYFDATVAHRVYNPNKKPAQLLCVHHARHQRSAWTAQGNHRSIRAIGKD
ncbi:MAG: cupin domain-containing protein [Planctomycetaceae bacterium]|nr:cupin domain-containing protein [Planctomycetaceae bacterium]